jgi:hypothetical protein
VRRAFVIALAAFGLAGCPSPDPTQGYPSPSPPAQLLDYNGFVCEVMPTLIRRCSFLACHGQDAHALRIYSAGKLRLHDDGTRNSRDGMLTADEVQRNFDSAAALVLDATADQRAAGDVQHVLLLEKPLRARFGGGEHHGVGVFPAYPATSLDQDAEWNALVAWVGGKKEPTPLAGDCAQTFSTLQLTPR